MQPARASATSAAEFPVWKTIQLGEYRDVNSVRSAFENAPCPMGIGASVDEAIGRPTFSFTRTRVAFDLVVVSVSGLGFAEDGASISAIYERAHSLGLELCPPDLGLVLRLKYLNQPRGEFLHIAMKPAPLYSRELVDFTVGNDGAGLLILGGEARADLVLAGAVRFVFVQPRSDAVAQEQARPDSAGLAKR